MSLRNCFSELIVTHIPVYNSTVKTYRKWKAQKYFQKCYYCKVQKTILFFISTLPDYVGHEIFDVIFGKIAILKIWELFSLGGVKTQFGKLALKWCNFRHDFICILTNITLMTLLRIPYLGRIGSTSFVLPILNRVIRVQLFSLSLKIRQVP